LGDFQGSFGRKTHRRKESPPEKEKAAVALPLFHRSLDDL